jgi:hypothetical protein
VAAHAVDALTPKRNLVYYVLIGLRVGLRYCRFTQAICNLGL